MQITQRSGKNNPKLYLSFNKIPNPYSFDYISISDGDSENLVVMRSNSQVGVWNCAVYFPSFYDEVSFTYDIMAYTSSKIYFFLFYLFLYYFFIFYLFLLFIYFYFLFIFIFVLNSFFKLKCFVQTTVLGTVFAKTQESAFVTIIIKTQIVHTVKN